MSRADAPLKRGLTWAQLAREERPQRLKYGKHFDVDVRELEAAADEAATRMGRAVRTMRDELGRRNRYLWLQFGDAEVFAGDPCPRCGGLSLTRTHEHFANCDVCGARLILSAKRPAPAPVAIDPVKQAKAAFREEQRRASGFRDVELVRDDRLSRPDREVFWGRGVDSRGVPMLLQVRYPLADGERIPDPASPGEDVQRVFAVALPTLRKAADAGVLALWLADLDEAGDDDEPPPGAVPGTL